MEERHGSDYQIVDYAQQWSWARNEAPVTVYGGSHTWSGILHTHPEVHKGYQLSGGAGASGKNGRLYRRVWMCTSCRQVAHQDGWTCEHGKGSFERKAR